ncbi:MAG: PCMD domain-containing protein [Bacteroidales bacterium]|jgi:hypothetical protein|nr:PCMD domain-containing protein [Bacteroidales bacterium]
MKTALVTGIALLIFASLSAQTTIPNAGFEDWTAEGSYENPNSWDSPNDVTSSLGIVVVEKEEVYVHSGNYAAMITVKSSIAGNMPGVLTLGDFSFDLLSMTATIEGGIPFTGKPEKISGWYQYDPNNNDICLIGAFLLQDNGGTWDTIATAGFESSATVQTWTQFEADFDYRNTNNPTHLNIILMPTDRNNPQSGSTIYIDDLELSYTQSILEKNQNLVKSYSDYDANMVKISFPEVSKASVLLMDINGKNLKEIQISGNEASLEMKGISNGIYVLQIADEFNIYSTKIIW